MITVVLLEHGCCGIQSWTAWRKMAPFKCSLSEKLCVSLNCVQLCLWHTLWLHSKMRSRGTFLVADEGLRKGEMQWFFPEVYLWWMSNLNLSILLRNPGPGTTTVRKWIFIHGIPSLSLSTVHQTAIHVAAMGYLSCSHTLCLEINSKLNKFYATLYFWKHLRVISRQAAIKTFNHCSLCYAEIKHNPIS